MIPTVVKSKAVVTLMVGGSCGIRTHEARSLSRFQVWCIKPLCQASPRFSVQGEKNMAKPEVRFCSETFCGEVHEGVAAKADTPPPHASRL